MQAPRRAFATAIARRARSLAIALCTLAAPGGLLAAPVADLPLSAAEAAALADLEAEWRAGRASLAGAGGGCMLGLQVELRGRRIIAVRPPADASAIAPGDTLRAIDGMAIADGAAYELLIDGRPASASVRVTFGNGAAPREAEITCRDRDVWRATFIAGIDAALDGEYEDCLARTDELDRYAGQRVGHAKLAYECLQAARVAGRYRPRREIAAMYFDIYRRLALPSRYSAAYADNVRETVEWAAALLNRFGAEEFAGRLHTLLRSSPP